MANQLAYELLIVGKDAIGPTESLVGGGVGCAVFYVEKGAVRFRGDQTSPTGVVGKPIEIGGHLRLTGEGAIRNAKFISRDGGEADVHAEYFDEADVIASFGNYPAANVPVEIVDMDQLLDGIERIQQQLAKVNEDEDLAPGERHYGSD